MDARDQDELYHGQRGPAEHMHILATAYSDKAKGGTGTNEPMVWVIPYGKGRVFTTVLGHVGGAERPGDPVRRLPDRRRPGRRVGRDRQGHAPHPRRLPDRRQGQPRRSEGRDGVRRVPETVLVN